MTLRKIKAWVRLIATLILVFLAVLVVAKNWNNRADLWFFHAFNVPVIWLLVITAIVSVVGFWIIKGVHRAFKDVKHADEPEKR